MLKFQSATNFFKTWPIAKKSDSLYSAMIAQCPHEVWLTSDEHCSRSSVLKCPAPYDPVLTKFQSTIEFLIFGRSPKKSQPILAPDYDTVYKVWLKSNENC